ncbi:MAG: hypothetical protein QF752_13640 [Planctomycetota bacterium]|jgi:hypothetical protein|nr:hypothetical protein [Planctomycetota bacterium]
MSFYQENKSWVRLVGIQGCMLVVLGPCVLGGLGDKVEQARKDSHNERNTLQSLFAAKVPPEPGLVSQAQESRSRLATLIQRLENRIAFERNPSLTLKSVEGSVDFFKMRLALQSEFTRRQSEFSMPFPPDLGFGDSNPTADELDRALLRLDMSRDILEAAFAARVRRIVSIDHSVSTPSQSEPYLIETPLRLVLEGSSDQVAEFLHEVLRGTRRAFALRQATVKSRSKDSLMTLEVTLGALLVQEGDEVAKALQAGIEGGQGGYGGSSGTTPGGAGRGKKKAPRKILFEDF